MAPSAVADDSHSRVSLSWWGGGGRLYAGKQMQEGPLLQEETKPGFQSSGEPPALRALPGRDCLPSFHKPPPQKKTPLGEILFGFHIQGPQDLPIFFDVVHSPLLPFFSSLHPHLLLAFGPLLACPISCSLLPSPGKWKSINTH